MNSLLRSLLAFFTLGAVMIGCGKQESAATPADVTLVVPAMN